MKFNTKTRLMMMTRLVLQLVMLVLGSIGVIVLWGMLPDNIIIKIAGGIGLFMILCNMSYDAFKAAKVLIDG